ncbi:hypothetical protein NMY22_g20176 [Coprinellus aureogranulatus]|nr:hypothetical protein NMY22_g20176 [Coprinellus aureogranulatus]
MRPGPSAAVEGGEDGVKPWPSPSPSPSAALAVATPTPPTPTPLSANTAQDSPQPSPTGEGEGEGEGEQDWIIVDIPKSLWPTSIPTRSLSGVPEATAEVKAERCFTYPRKRKSVRGISHVLWVGYPRNAKANDALAASESTHSRWSSSASTVRERFMDDRASRRASECHVKAFSPVLLDGHSRKAHISLDDIHESPDFPNAKAPSRRFARRRGFNNNGNSDMTVDSSPPELPLLRMSSFPDMVAAASLSLSSITPESTPLSMSDTFTLSDTSSLRGLVGFASEFPQPPSLSPALRRMQSVPWLKDIHAASFDAEESYSWRRASQATERSTRDADTSFSRGANELPFPRPAMALEELEKGSPLDRLREETKASEISWTKRQTYKTRTTDDLLEWSKSNRSQDVNTSGLSGRRNRTESTPAVAAPIRQLPAKRPAGRRNTVSSITSHEPVQRLEKSRTIRKVASMQSDAKGKPLHESNSGQRTIPKIKSLRLFPSATSSSKREGKLQAVSGTSDERTQATAKPRNWLFLRAPSTTKLAKDSTSHQRHQSRASRSLGAIARHTPLVTSITPNKALL